MEQKQLANFGRGPFEDYFKFGPMVKEMLFKDYCFFIFLDLVAILFGGAEPLVQSLMRNILVGTIWAILVEGLVGTIV